jgi:hypothetical protein
LVACPCGVACRNQLGVRAHQGKKHCFDLSGGNGNCQNFEISIENFSGGASILNTTTTINNPINTATINSTHANIQIPRNDPPAVAAEEFFGGLNYNYSEQYFNLSLLPITTKPLFGKHAINFRNAAARIASAYIAAPTEENLFNFLCLPKVGLTAGLSSGDLKLHLEKYPAVGWPQQKERCDTKPPESIIQKVSKSVKAGKLSQAARQLREDSRVADLSDENLETMKILHPEGPVNPFGRSPQLLPEEVAVKTCVNTFNKDVSPGISG